MCATQGPSQIDRKGLLNANSHKLYSKYLRMWRTMGWWWDVYGNNGDFTIEDFITLILNYETGYLGNKYIETGSYVFQSFAEALTRNSHQYCIYNSCDISTPEGRLSWLGGWSQVARKLAKGTRDANQWDNPTNHASIINNSIINPASFGHPEWAEGKVSGRPYNAANAFLNIDMAKRMYNRGWLWFASDDPSKDSNALLIFTGCQDDYFHSDPKNHEYQC